MFRELVRKKQQLPLEECLRLLQTQPRGVLSVLGDNGYPYGLPIDYWYNGEDGRLYFHSGNSGHKIDALLANPKASFCVMDQGTREDGDWALHFKSVIVFGTVQFIRDPAEAIELTRRLSRKYTPDEAYIQSEIDHYASSLAVFCLVPEQITGKITHEA